MGTSGSKAISPKYQPDKSCNYPASLFIQRFCLMKKLLVFFASLWLIIFSSAGRAQSSSSKGDFKLVVDVNLVGILATVTTPEGALVSDLKQEDFQIYENGQLQDIVLFSKEADQPLRLSLLFDSSVSIATELKTQQEAAIEFLRSILRPSDHVSIFKVSEEVEELVRFGNQVEKLSRAIRSIKPQGGTSLYDAVFLASENLTRVRGRKVILIISDGTDTTSHKQLKDCLKIAQNSEAVVYALVVQPIKSEPGRNLAGEHAMIFLTEKTGGKFYKISTPDSLRSSFTAISDELRTQYYLGYYPKKKTGGDEFHRIEIRVSNPAYKIRAREGYYTPVR
jgi:Ca-activated chloride channel homolog